MGRETSPTPAVHTIVGPAMSLVLSNKYRASFAKPGDPCKLMSPTPSTGEADNKQTAYLLIDGGGL